MADLPHAQRGERRTAPGPGTVILDQAFREIAATPEAEEWMSRIRSTSDGKFTPTAVLEVAARVRSLRTARPLPGEEPRVRVRGSSGEWVTISAAPLTGESALSGAIAVTLAGSGAEAGTLLLEARGLTARERELASLVLAGYSNREIAERLFLSPYTVGDHLKAILEKVGAHGKRELIASALGCGWRGLPHGLIPTDPRERVKETGGAASASRIPSHATWSFGAYEVCSTCAIAVSPA